MNPTLDFRKARAPVSVWGTGDWHLSSTAHDAALFTKHFNRAVDEHWHLLHVGDGLEMVTPSSRVAQRGALNEQTALPAEQREILIGYLRKLTGKGFILAGNHELRVDMATGLDFIKTVTDAKGVSIEPLSEPGVVDILVGSQTYHVYVHHGEGPVVNPISLFDRIQRDVEGLDLILAGHIHSSTSDPAEVDTPTGARVIHRLRTGHYLKNPKYVLLRPIARRGARGSWLLTFDPHEHSVQATWLS